MLLEAHDVGSVRVGDRLATVDGVVAVVRLLGEAHQDGGVHRVAQGLEVQMLDQQQKAREVGGDVVRDGDCRHG